MTIDGIAAHLADERAALLGTKLTRAASKVVLISVCVFALVISVPAQDPGDLAAKSIEELMDIKVTSVSKKEEKLFQSAAAVYVITQEDIRRSGMTSIPDLLRMVPGLDVARIDGTKWAVAARGFNSRFTNKLLVLIDGRSVYSPDTSGVYWEALDLPLETIERIEVIRGPGGTLWGANAVNGVINIITKKAVDTQGGLVTAGGGSEDRFGSVQYGGKAGAQAYYRVYAKYLNTSGLLLDDGSAASDGKNSAQGGMRLDWQPSSRDSLSFQGGIYDVSLKERPSFVSARVPFTLPGLTSSGLRGGDLLGRWSRAFSESSDMALQVYWDRSYHNVFDVGIRLDTVDLDFQHHFVFGARQDVVWGLGYRLVAANTNSSAGAPVFTSKAERTQLFSGFLQDEFTLVNDRLRLTAGAKVERNSFTGFEIQPSIRLLWTPGKHQTVWAAVSRAVRTPSLAEEALNVSLSTLPAPDGTPVVLELFGNPDFKSETLLAYEVGYRAQRGKLSLDVATFYNAYGKLKAAQAAGAPIFEFAPPHLVLPRTFGNLAGAQTYGVEVSANCNVTANWKVSAGYSFLHMRSHSNSAIPGVAPPSPGDNPQHQFQLRSYFNLPRKFELDAGLYRVSALTNQGIPAYTRLDLRLGWRPAESIELSVGGQNLLHKGHTEFNATDIGIIDEDQVKRSAYAKLTWRF
jgi:iron complex outermembrane receptor protein